jgi:hypothetical protein
MVGCVPLRQKYWKVLSVWSAEELQVGPVFELRAMWCEERSRRLREKKVSTVLAGSNRQDLPKKGY